MNDFDPNLNPLQPKNPEEDKAADGMNDSIFDEPIIENAEAPTPSQAGSQKPVPELTLEPDLIPDPIPEPEPVPMPEPEPMPEPSVQSNTEYNGYQPPTYTGNAGYYQPPQYGYPPQYGQPQYTRPPADPSPYPGIPYYQPHQQYAQYSQTPPPGYQQKSRLAAALLGLMYGGLGIHNFYLGFTTRAIIQLVVFLVGLIFTLGIVSIGIYIWGVVEGIQLLIGRNERLYDANNVILKD